MSFDDRLECSCCGGTLTDDDTCGDCGCTPEPVSVADALDDFLDELGGTKCPNGWP